MTFQISKILVYSNKMDINEPQCVYFNENSLNIIVGPTLSGKTSMIAIIKYCLGEKNQIPDGIILDNASWVGVEFLLDVNHETGEKKSLFVIRSLPRPGGKPRTYTKSGYNQDVPKKDELNSNTGRESISSIIEKELGIDVISIANEYGTVYSSKYNLLKEVSTYCFQSQTEIGSNTAIFHEQQNNSKFSIKDWLPFILKTALPDYADKRKHLEDLYNRRATLKKSDQLKLTNEVHDRYIEEAKGIFEDGQKAGLIPRTDVLHNTIEGIQEQFKAYTNLSLDNLELPRSSSSEIQKIKSDLISEKIKLAKYEKEKSYLSSFMSSKDTYDLGVERQLPRLRTINLFHEKDGQDICPLCSSKLSNPSPSVKAIHNRLENLEKNLESSKNSNESLSIAYIRSQELTRLTRKTITSLQKRLNELEAEDQHLKSLKDKNQIQTEVVGAIRWFLKRLTKDFESEITDAKELEEVEKEIKEWENDSEYIDSNIRLKEILHYLNEKITQYAQSIQLFNADYQDEYTLSLNVDRGRIIVTKGGEEVKIDVDQENIGGGTRWVALHVIIHLALHEYFANNGCPVPNFIFLDQPSQAHSSYNNAISSDSKEKPEPNEDYRKLIELVSSVITKTPLFQVIITEQVDYGPEQPWYNDYVVENWKVSGKKLIPKEWKPTEQSGI